MGAGKQCCWIVASILGLAWPLAGRGAASPLDEAGPAAELSTVDFTRLSLEDLMNVEVTSVSKSRHRVADAPGAVYVISQEDIRRSGMTYIPELLRMAPGMEVARLNASQWAVSARGFNDRFANKLLVLMDGRTVYQPMFSGVYWDTIDYVLEDLDRIEIIRGPGATLWGANAVNGVINITTKSAKETQGALVVGELGTDQDISAVRYGGRLDEKTWYRLYSKYRNVDNQLVADGSDAHDGWEMLRGGFRIDRHASAKDTWTIQGDLHGGREGSTWSVPVFAGLNERVNEPHMANVGGGNLLVRWTHVICDTSDFSIQLYYDRIERTDLPAGYTQETVDLDVQHRFALGRSQEIIWGAGYRFLADEMDNDPLLHFDPERRNDYLVSAFVQDRLTLVPERLYLFAGSKLEVNSYSGFEIQPSLRVLWTPNERNSAWAAVSRAVRTPSRFEEDAHVVFGRGTNPLTGMPVSIESIGDIHQKSEELTAWELGYRFQATKSLSLDLAAFYNVYNNLRSADPGPGVPESDPPPPHLVIPYALGNDVQGETYGLEVAANWNLSDAWRLVAGYSFLMAHLSDPSGQDIVAPDYYEQSSPHHQFNLRSHLNLTPNLELNAGLYYVDNVPGFNVPAYVRTDVNLAWRIKPGLEWTIGARNAFDDRHREFGRTLFDQPSEIPRAFYTRLVWKF